MGQLLLFDNAAAVRGAALAGRALRPRNRPRALALHRDPYPTQRSFPFSPSTLVREFHDAFGLVVTSHPTVALPAELMELRLGLIDEETQELAAAVNGRDLVAIADALGDIVYVTFGAALTFGIDLDAVLAEIHRSNMTKLGSDGKPVVRGDGKVLKGPGYSPPSLREALGL